MKAFLLAAVVLFSNPVFALESWCVWDGEEYIKEQMTQNKQHWLEAVYALHTADSTSDIESFEGVGSCRFIDRSLGGTVAEAISGYLNSYSLITATRAYLKIGASNEIVMPEAFYAAGTNWVYVEKNFYAMNRPVCEKQKAQMVELGKNAQGIRFTDVEYKKNQFGGVSAVINANTTDTNSLGICHFN
jgi:hypothetical protein